MTPSNKSVIKVQQHLIKLSCLRSFVEWETIIKYRADWEQNPRKRLWQTIVILLSKGLPDPVYEVLRYPAWLIGDFHLLLVILIHFANVYGVPVNRLFLLFAGVLMELWISFSLKRCLKPTINRKKYKWWIRKKKPFNIHHPGAIKVHKAT